MLGRLLVGIVKGIVLGGLLGFGLLKLGQAVPIAIVAYLAAAVTGILIGLIAGKPIWAPDAKIEAGMKAGVGALLGGCYDADNTPEPDKPASKDAKAPATKSRIAETPSDEELEDDLSEEPEKKKDKK